MNNKIAHCFSALKLENRAAVIPYITIGDPDLDTTYRAILTLAGGGADMIELGIPFTDPVADGPVIQKACTRALLNGFKIADVFTLIRRVRQAGIDIPLILMSYANPVFAMGFDAFCRNAADCGANALLITDIPPEESGDYIASARTCGLDTVFLCSPTTSAHRLRLIDDSSSGFVYYVAQRGVTGVRTSLSDDFDSEIARIQSVVRKPLCVGFGISTPAQAVQVAQKADGLIIGSAIVSLFEQHSGDALQTSLLHFIKSIREAVSNARTP